jgi:hypothetical protein
LQILKGNQNPYIEEEQTTQWPKEKVQKDKQQSTKHTHKTGTDVKPSFAGVTTDRLMIPCTSFCGMTLEAI